VNFLEIWRIDILWTEEESIKFWKLSTTYCEYQGW